MSAFSTFALNYCQVLNLTPTMMTALVFGIVNTVSRGLTIFAPLMTELVKNSGWTITLLALVGLFSTRFFHEGTKLHQQYLTP